MILTLALSVFIGVSLGMMGGGGSILAVPLLTYIAGFLPQQAIAASLLIVDITSAVGVLGHVRHGRVQWRTGLLFGTASMAGAFAGGLLGGRLPGTILIIAFAVMMLVTAIAMLRNGSRTQAQPDGGRTPLPRPPRPSRWPASSSTGPWWA